jgi:hypothetical protein
MLSWSKMRCWSRVLILLTVALVAFNAQCFAYCLTQGGGNGATHCHQHGKAKCPQQHELTTSSAQAPSPRFSILAPVMLVAVAINPISRRCVELLSESPPATFGKVIPLPLRV